MTVDVRDSLVFVETKAEIKDPEVLGQRSYRDIFLKHKDAQAIWIMRPDAQEPYRVPWQTGLYGKSEIKRKHRKNSKKKEQANDQA